MASPPAPNPNNEEEISDNKAHPLLLESVMVSVFKYLDTEELYICCKVCRMWNVVSREFRNPPALKVISSRSDMESHMRATELGESRDKYTRFLMCDINLCQDIVRAYFEKYMEAIRELRILSSCTGAEYVLRGIQFPNLRRLLVEAPLACGFLPNQEFGFGVKRLRKLSLNFNSMSIMTDDSMEILAGLRRLENMEKLTLEGQLSARYPVFLRLHLYPDLKIRTLILSGSAMQLHIDNSGGSALTHLEMDGTHQLKMKHRHASVLSLKSLVLRKEHKAIGNIRLHRVFPELTSLTAAFRRNRAKTFLPMVFRLEKLETLSIAGDNIRNKMLCEKSDSIESSFDYKPRRVWEHFTNTWKQKPCIFTMQSLKSLTIESPMLTSTIALHGLRFCHQLVYLKLKMNRNNRLRLEAMEALADLENLDEIIVECPDDLDYTCDELRTHLAFCRLVLAHAHEEMFDNLPEVRRIRRHLL